MTVMTLDRAFLLNPTVSLPKGTLAPFVDMGALQPFRRDVRAVSRRPYMGGMKFLDGDVLMARITPSLENGKTSIYRAAPGETGAAFGSTEFIIIRGRTGVSDTHYAYYLFTSHELREHAIASMNGSSGRQRVQLDSLASFEVDLPAIGEQRAIAATLGALDDKVESNRRAATQALTLARAYVDRATAGRPPVAYGSAIEVLMGAAFKGENFCEPGLGRPLLRIRDLKTFESQTWTTETRKDETVIRPGDIVVGMDAEFRATLWLGRESVLNQRVCSFHGKPGVGRAFVLAALEPLLAFQEQAKTGTTVIHLNKADIDTFEVPSLTVKEHQDLSAITEPLMELAVHRALEARMLARTRDILLPELLSRRIRVAKARETIQDVVA